MKLIKQINGINWHRNGVGGTPFHVVDFTPIDDGEIPERMVAIVFEGESGCCAVLDPEEMCTMWRGDRFEHELRKAIKREDA